MKKCYLLSALLLFNFISVLSAQIYDMNDISQIKSVMDVSSYEVTYYEDYDSYEEVTYLNIENHWYGFDLLEEAIVENKPEAVEIILRNLDSNYDFLGKRNRSNIKDYRVIDLAKNYGSKTVRYMVYDAAIEQLFGSYSIYDYVNELLDDNESFLEYTFSKKNEFINEHCFDNDLLYTTIEKANIPCLEFLADNVFDFSKIKIFEEIYIHYTFEKTVTFEAKKQVFDILLENGANIDILPNLSKSDLEYFFKDFKDMDYLILMLENGMPVDLVKDTCLLTVLDYYSDLIADEKGAYIVSMLIQKGANVHYIDKDSGKSVLYNACDKNHKDAVIIRMILEAGATTKLTFKQKFNGCYPANQIFWAGNYEGLKALKEYGLKLNNKKYLLRASDSPRDSVECLELVLSDYKNIKKAVNKKVYGKNLFWHAAWRGNVAIMKYLTEHGAKVNSCNLKARQELWLILKDLFLIATTVLNINLTEF